jgi:hypothetical protein
MRVVAVPRIRREHSSQLCIVHYPLPKASRPVVFESCQSPRSRYTRGEVRAAGLKSLQSKIVGSVHDHTKYVVSAMTNWESDKSPMEAS